MTKKIRCSSLPIMVKCGQSIHTDNPVSMTSAMAENGTSFHDDMKNYITKNAHNFLEIPDRDRTDRNVINALYILRDALESVGLMGEGIDQPQPMTEPDTKFACDVGDEVVLEGTSDLLLWYGNTVVVVDWKSGISLGDYYDPQLMGYAYLAYNSRFNNSTKFITITINNADRTYCVNAYSFESLLGLRDMITHAITIPSYSVGIHCAYCGRKTDCKAYLDYIKLAVSTMAVTFVDAEGNDIVPADLGNYLLEARHKIKMLERAIDEAKIIMSTVVKANGGKLEFIGGELVVAESTVNQLDAGKAWEFLTGKLSTAELTDCMTISITKVLDAYSKRFPRGQKGAAKEDLKAMLINSGAVVQSVRTQIKESYYEQKGDQ